MFYMKYIEKKTDLMNNYVYCSSLKQQSAGRHVAPLGLIILVPRQQVFALIP
jgi:hypothetical protein